MQQLIILARYRKGNGGMQQYCRDLMSVCAHLYGERAHCIPVTSMRNALSGLLQSAVMTQSGCHVHCCDAALAPIGLLLRRLNPAAHLSITAHGLDIVYPRKAYQSLLRKCLPLFDRVVCVSRATARQVTERGINHSSVVTVPCGVWASAGFLPQSLRRRPELLSVCRLIPRKGIDWFITQVLPILAKAFPTIHYSVIGDGPARDSIECAIDSVNMHGHVTLLGTANDDVRNSCYHQASLFVMPNIPIKGDMEGFGIACIEAASRGLPVAAARIEGLCDAVQESRTGNFFRSGDPLDAARLIVRMLREPMNSQSVQEHAIRMYDWHALAERYRHDVFELS